MSPPGVRRLQVIFAPGQPLETVLMSCGVPLSSRLYCAIGEACAGEAFSGLDFNNRLPLA